MLISFDSIESRRRATVGPSRKSFCSCRVDIVANNPFESTNRVGSTLELFSSLESINVSTSDKFIARSAVYAAVKISAPAEEKETRYCFDPCQSIY